MAKRLILLELNEVPNRVLEDFCARRPGSALARLRKESAVAVTETPDEGHLSPWITWPTFHRGVSNSRHGLAAFGQPLDSIDQRFPPIWQILTRSNVHVGLFGSLHSYPIPSTIANYDFYVPDTFAAGPECLPIEVSAFQRFNLAMVSKSARNVSSEIPGHAWRFLPKSVQLGVTLSTMGKVAMQLASELFAPWKRVRRRTFQATLGFDIFYSLLSEKKPQFATFFTNHVASAMHRYWAASFPEDFSASEYDDAWRGRYGSEIDWAMRHADSYVEKMVEYCKADGDTALLIASSMGQAAAHGGKRVAKQLYLEDPQVFMRALGLEDSQWERRPAMLPQFNAIVAADAAESFEASLGEVEIGGAPVPFDRQPGGFFSISFGHTDLAQASDTFKLRGAATSAESLGLHDVTIEDEAGSTAYHIPQGIFLYFDPTVRHARQLPRAVSTLAVAPAICRFFGIAAPSYMSPDKDLEALFA